ncbi:MAG TPA: hypothetical protein VFV75_11975 [Candidatus Polarisedimenticolaceae bacterium]|nr:hypothetical protein [Candidatus Polarisedimenticolaceae bacterium]
MSEHSAIYDLGEIHAGRRASAHRQASAAAVAQPSALPALAASVAIFLPGMGHLLLQEFQAALFFSATMGCAVAVGWALSTCFDSLLSTLGLLGIAPWTLAVAFVTLYVMTAALHVTSVLDAHGARLQTCLPRRPPSIVAALFSALVPGWGQILVGKRARAGLFLCCLWVLGAAWLLSLHEARVAFFRLGLRLPLDRGFVDQQAPIVMLVVTGVLWGVAVWDAAASRSSRR